MAKLVEIPEHRGFKAGDEVMVDGKRKVVVKIEQGIHYERDRPPESYINWTWDDGTGNSDHVHIVRAWQPVVWQMIAMPIHGVVMHASRWREIKQALTPPDSPLGRMGFHGGAELLERLDGLELSAKMRAWYQPPLRRSGYLPDCMGLCDLVLATTRGAVLDFMDTFTEDGLHARLIGVGQ